MKILITGATGFIGKNLQQYLPVYMPEVELYFLTRKKTGAPREYTWNELHSLSLKNIDAVIHLAGLAHDTKNAMDPEAYFTVNFELTKMLYDWYLQSNASKFIYVSSVKAVADKVEGILTEEVKPAPRTPYGKSKLKAEEYISQLSLGLRHKSHYILRPCMVHGPGNKGNLNLLYRFVANGLPYPLGAFHNKRSFLSVDNFCFVCKELLTRNISSGAYNLADDDPLSTKELFGVIAATIGRKPKIWNLSESMVRTMAKMGDALNLPVNSERLEKLTENYVVSNHKIKSALGIAAMPVSVKDGVSKTIYSFAQYILRR